MKERGKGARKNTGEEKEKERRVNGMGEVRGEVLRGRAHLM